MRLICPNCDAQYDIDDDVIPEGGREVQCSNCQHTWFQTKTPQRTRSILTPTSPAAEKAVAETDKISLAPAPRRALDSSVANILREEAARNLALPKTEVTATEKTTESAAQRAAQTRARISRLTEQQPAPTPAAIAAASTGAVMRSSQRNVPDIQEINATLRAHAQTTGRAAVTGAEQEPSVQRRGFRRGFTMMLVLLAIAIMPYFFAAQIVEQLPQTRTFMTQYIQTIDQLRIQLHDVAGQISTMIKGLIPAAAETPVPDMAAPSDG
ncbi:zinc-ribbon domain-containing protein [Yoonia sp.]|uniref:zinc-ribbon domain-containing protein n=1 Tax=Yoonia sp. TaxID=2212373 RepID=UPI0019DB54D9|nr:zinc-ribbon domain-containing protein [Yoonia sp.]MBE0414442.1 zinc-ribbon domain-containing protein [Yoonia sp.]